MAGKCQQRDRSAMRLYSERSLPRKSYASESETTRSVVSYARQV